MKSKNYIEELSTSLYKEICDVNKLTIKRKQRMLVSSINDTQQFLLFNFKKYNSGYNIGLMLSFPNLWMQFTVEKWHNLIANNFPRRKVIDDDHKLINDDGEFTDLIFLHRYLKINSIKMLIDNQSISKMDIINCLIFCKKYSYKFFISQEELIEDLDDFYEITLNQLEAYSIDLTNNGLSSGFKNDDDLIDYVNEIASRYDFKL